MGKKLLIENRTSFKKNTGESEGFWGSRTGGDSVPDVEVGLCWLSPLASSSASGMKHQQATEECKQMFSIIVCRPSFACLLVGINYSLYFKIMPAIQRPHLK